MRGCAEQGSRGDLHATTNCSKDSLRQPSSARVVRTWTDQRKQLPVLAHTAGRPFGNHHHDHHHQHHRACTLVSLSSSSTPSPSSPHCPRHLAEPRRGLHVPFRSPTVVLASRTLTTIRQVGEGEGGLAPRPPGTLSPQPTSVRPADCTSVCPSASAACTSGAVEGQ